MTTDYRSLVIRRMREHLEGMPARNNVLAVGIPLDALADIAIDTLTGGEGVPRVPPYDPSVFAARRWSEPVDPIVLDEQGGSFRSIGVDRDPDGDRGDVAWTVIDGTGDEHVVRLPAQSSLELAISAIAVTRLGGQA